MIAELCNKELITDLLVNNPMLGSDPPGAISLKRML